MKAIKTLIISIILIVALLIAAVLAHPCWVGKLVKASAENVGPRFTGTPIALELCDVNLYKGLVAVEGFALDNPKGCTEKTAASLGTARFQIDPISLATDVIVIKEITVKDLFISYEKLGEKTNFDIIAENAAGPSSGAGTTVEESTAPEVKPAEPTEKVEVAETKPAEGTESATKAEKRFIIEKLTLSGVRLSYMGFPIVVPVDINLTDIGKDSGGITLASAILEITDRIFKATGLIGGGLKDLGLKGLDVGAAGIDIGTAGVTNALEAVKNMDVDGAKQILKDTGANLKTSTKDFKKLGKDFKNIFK